MSASIRIASLALAFALVTALAPARASVEPPAVISTVAYTYLPGDTDDPSTELRVRRGRALLYVNLDVLDLHTVTADMIGDNGRPLFDSGAVQTARSAEVRGVDALPPGRYSFYCKLHGEGMTGVLLVA